MVDLRGRHSGDLQAARDRPLGERVVVLLARQPLLFDRDRQLPVPDDTGGRVVVNIIDTQNIHAGPPPASIVIEARPVTVWWRYIVFLMVFTQSMHPGPPASPDAAVRARRGRSRARRAEAPAGSGCLRVALPARKGIPSPVVHAEDAPVGDPPPALGLQEPFNPVVPDALEVLDLAHAVACPVPFVQAAQPGAGKPGAVDAERARAFRAKSQPAGRAVLRQVPATGVAPGTASLRARVGAADTAVHPAGSDDGRVEWQSTHGLSRPRGGRLTPPGTPAAPGPSSRGRGGPPRRRSSRRRPRSPRGPSGR